MCRTRMSNGTCFVIYFLLHRGHPQSQLPFISTQTSRTETGMELATDALGTSRSLQGIRRKDSPGAFIRHCSLRNIRQFQGGEWSRSPWSPVRAEETKRKTRRAVAWAWRSLWDKHEMNRYLFGFRDYLVDVVFVFSMNFIPLLTVLCSSRTLISFFCSSRTTILNLLESLA